MFLFLLFLLFTSPFVTCDDTQALRNAVKCLCEGNTEGEFGSCCAAHENGASITLGNTQCFISAMGLDSSNQFVTGLLVIHHILHFSFSFCSNRRKRIDCHSIWLFLFSLKCVFLFAFFCFSACFFDLSFLCPLLQQNSISSLSSESFEGLTLLKTFFCCFCCFYFHSFTLFEVFTATLFQLFLLIHS